MFFLRCWGAERIAFAPAELSQGVPPALTRHFKLRKGRWRMYSQTAWSGKVGRLSGLLLAITGLLVFSFPLLGQTTVSTGSIVGTVTDPSGAVVSGAKVVITNTATGQAISLKTN